MNHPTTRAEEESQRAEINRMRREAYQAQIDAVNSASFTKLSQLINNGDRWLNHWRKMMAEYGDISIKYTTSKNPWGAPYGFVDYVECSDGRRWRGTEGRSANGSTKAAINLV